MNERFRRGAGPRQVVDEGAMDARTAFVRAWFRSLLTCGRELPDDELLDAAKRLVAHLESIRATPVEREDGPARRVGEARLPVIAATAAPVERGRSPDQRRRDVREALRRLDPKGPDPGSPATPAPEAARALRDVLRRDRPRRRR